MSRVLVGRESDQPKRRSALPRASKDLCSNQSVPRTTDSLRVFWTQDLHQQAFDQHAKGSHFRIVIDTIDWRKVGAQSL